MARSSFLGRPMPGAFGATLGVMVLAVLVYLPGLSGPFLLDDAPNILQNPLLRIDGTLLDDWRTATMSGASGPLGRPVAMFTFALNHALVGGFDTASMKLFNVLLHLVNAALVYLVLRLLLSCPAFTALGSRQQRALALVTALIWLLHPMHVSTVLYVVQRMTQLSTLFTLLGLAVFLRYRLNWRDRVPSLGEMIQLASWLGLLALLATLSKENGVLLLPLVLLCEVFLFTRGGPRSAEVRRPVLWLFAAVLVMSLSMLLAMFLHDDILRAMAGYRHRDFDVYERLLTQGRVLWHYVIWLVAPNPDSFSLYHDDIPVSRGLLEPMSTLVALAAWIGLVVVVFVKRRQVPVIAFGLGFFLVAHALESSFLPLELAYEHRNYLPSLGVLLVVARLLLGLSDHFGRNRRTLVLGVAVLLAALSALRAQGWGDEYSLTLQQAEAHPASARAQIAIAQVLLTKLDEAISLGLDEVSVALAAQAQKRLDQAESLSPAGLAAPVLLLLLQDRWPDAGVDSRAMLKRIAQDVSSGKKQATDSAAMGRLVQCASRNPEVCDPLLVESIISKTREPAAHFPQASRLHYEWLLATNASTTQRDVALQRVLEVSPRSLWANAYTLREAMATGDASRMYRAVIHWYQNDHRRRRIPLIAAAFEAGQ